MNNTIYSSVFSRCPDIILITDCDFRVIDANPAALNQLGYEKEEILDTNLNGIFSDQKEGVSFFKKLANDRLINQNEYQFKKKEAAVFPVLLTAGKIDDQSNSFMIMAKDVSVYKKHNQEQSVKKEMMRIGNLAQTVSHDLKNPLNNIFMGLHQFRTILDEQNEENAFYLDFLEKNSKRINAVIANSLGPSTIFNLDKEAVDLNKLVSESAKSAEAQVQSSNIMLNLDLSEKPFMVELDKEKMRMAFDNIIQNAIESIKEEEEGIIYIRTTQNNGTASVMISDNGSGISEADKKNMGQPFFTTKPQKIGLGLLNTEQILNAHEVEMNVQSEIGKGSTFTLYF